MRIPSIVILAMSVLYFVLYSVYDIADLSGNILLVFNIILFIFCIIDIKNHAKLSPLYLNNDDMEQLKTLVDNKVSVSEMIQFGLSLHEMMDVVSERYNKSEKIKDFTFFVIPVNEEKELINKIKKLIQDNENVNK
jgi:hypothetical protein